MKLNFFLVVIVLFYGCTAKSEWSEIRGCVVEKGITEVGLYEVIDGQLKVMSTVQVDKDGEFGFLVRPAYEGFYVLGSLRVNHPLYLKAGDAVNVELGREIIRFVGENTAENLKIGEWEKLSESVRLKSLYFAGRQSTYEDFFPELEKLMGKVSGFRTEIRTSNPVFNTAFSRKIAYDVDFYALHFLYSPRRLHPKETDLPVFYKSILAADKFTDDFLLTLPYGVRYIGLCAMYGGRKVSEKMPAIERTFDFLACDRLKGEYLLSLIQRYKSYFQLQDALSVYGKFLVTDSQKARAEEIRRKLFKEAPKGEVIDFTYPDVNEKMVSLSDFKGKVVVVDVWATWCAPCRQQIPFLKKLEEAMHGRDVVFIGVSLDKKKDYEKWKKMVKDEGLKGVQLFADGFSKIAKDYNITGIPRFMVFDKQGKAVDIQAPRPSEPALKKMIEAELKK